MCFRNSKSKDKPDSSSASSSQGVSEKHNCRCGEIWLHVFSIFFTVIIFISCGWMFCETVRFDPSNSEYTEAWIKHRNEIRHYWYGVDSVGMAKPLTKGDMLRILKSQELVLNRQDVLVDDVRQETNNIINKMNGWLGFWIGIVALVGVFVPVALQFKLYRESKEKEKELSDKITNALDSFKTDLECQEREILGRIREVTFTTLVRNFQNVFECPVTQVQESRNHILQEILSRIKMKVEENIRLYCCRIDTNENSADDLKMNEGIGETGARGCAEAMSEYELTVMLIQVTNVINSIKKLTPHKNRSLDRILIQITNLISNLNTPGIPQSEIISNLQDFGISFRLLSIPV